MLKNLFYIIDVWRACHQSLVPVKRFRPETSRIKIQMTSTGLAIPTIVDLRTVATATDRKVEKVKLVEF